MTTDRKSILITVGTDHHPFDRLVDWAEEWAANNPDAHVTVQFGASRASQRLDGYERISHPELRKLMSEADVVVTHGGGGSISDCWNSGKVPLVVARSKSLNEHVDDHQIAFARRLHEMGYIHLADTYMDFADNLRRLLSADGGTLPAIELEAPTRTAAKIGELIDQMVYADRPSRRG